MTVDLEPDCPPYLGTFAGAAQGTPQLLELFARCGVRATFFTTGEVARRAPQLVRSLLAQGHELGCHGDSHRRFSEMQPAEADEELRAASATLRSFGSVTSFRAPNLDFPAALLPLLRAHGYRLDSSQGRHKRGSLLARPQRCLDGALLRVPVATPSYVLRLMRLPRRAVLRLLPDPVVLFTHPWELLELRDPALPFTCRYRTGGSVLARLADTLAWFQRRGATFLRMDELPT